MLMRRPGEFEGNFKPTLIGQKPTEEQEKEIDRARRVQSSRIRNIVSASRFAPEFDELAGWFCLSVKDRREFAVENFLRSRDVEACVPRCLGEPRRHRGRLIDGQILPVVNGYVLVRCVPSISAFVGLREEKHVTGIVGRGEFPYRISDKLVIRFRNFAERGAFDHREAKCYYKTGETVKVIDGPFASFPAIVTCIDDVEKKARINVEVHIFGRPTPMELDIAQIEKI